MGRTIGENCREWRERAGYSSPGAVVAALVKLYPHDPKKHFSRTYIYELENDAANPTLEFMRTLASLYGCPLWLLVRTDADADYPEPNRLPKEYEPLDALISPLPQDKREAAVLNLAAHLLHTINTFGHHPLQVEDSLASPAPDALKMSHTSKTDRPAAPPWRSRPAEPKGTQDGGASTEGRGRYPDAQSKEPQGTTSKKPRT